MLLTKLRRRPSHMRPKWERLRLLLRLAVKCNASNVVVDVTDRKVIEDLTTNYRDEFRIIIFAKM